jgi:hypothetical protein
MKKVMTVATKEPPTAAVAIQPLRGSRTDEDSSMIVKKPTRGSRGISSAT